MTTRPRAQRIKAKAGYHHGDLRRQLVLAAWRLIDRHGVDGFRLADAAALAGVSAAAPYRHFQDRDALLLAVSDEGFERLGAQLGEAARAHADGSVDAICATGVAYIAFARGQPHLFRVMFSDHADTSGQEAGEPTAAGAAAYAVLVRQVAASLSLEADAPATLGTALSLWMLVHGFASLLIDEQLGVGRLEIDIEAMVRANTRQMLGAFTN